MASLGGVFGNSYFDSVSGLRDANLRLNVSAHNIANTNTPHFQPQRVESVAEKSGGVRGILFEANSGILQSEPSSAESQTDPATEAINQTLARRAFDANLKALKSQHDAELATINMVG